MLSQPARASWHTPTRRRAVERDESADRSKGAFKLIKWSKARYHEKVELICPMCNGARRLSLGKDQLICPSCEGKGRLMMHEYREQRAESRLPIQR
jgi:uncharacterized protein YbaR (Trm112 family)